MFSPIPVKKLYHCVHNARMLKLHLDKVFFPSQPGAVFSRELLQLSDVRII